VLCLFVYHFIVSRRVVRGRHASTPSLRRSFFPFLLEEALLWAPHSMGFGLWRSVSGCFLCQTLLRTFRPSCAFPPRFIDHVGLGPVIHACNLSVISLRFSGLPYADCRIYLHFFLRITPFCTLLPDVFFFSILFPLVQCRLDQLPYPCFFLFAPESPFLYSLSAPSVNPPPVGHRLVRFLYFLPLLLHSSGFFLHPPFSFFLSIIPFHGLGVALLHQSGVNFVLSQNPCLRLSVGFFFFFPFPFALHSAQADRLRRGVPFQSSLFNCGPH